MDRRKGEERECESEEADGEREYLGVTREGGREIVGGGEKGVFEEAVFGRSHRKSRSYKRRRPGPHPSHTLKRPYLPTVTRHSTGGQGISHHTHSGGPILPSITEPWENRRYGWTSWHGTSRSVTCCCARLWQSVWVPSSWW